ncbi:MAG: hypothetical protein IPL49_13410 [Saprospirales bacterium]|nr:hypothetical protein [Saprospirales bacterium]
MKTLLSFLVFIFLFFSSYSQSLKIYVDAASGKTSYVCGKDTLEKPVVKRGETINLYLSNFNNYLYEVEIEESQKQTTYFSTGVDTSQLGSNLAKSPGGSSAFDLISTIMNPSGLLGLNQLAGGQLSFLGGMSFGSKGFAADDEEAMILQQLQDWEFQYEKALEDWARTENSLMTIQQNVERLVNAKAIQSMASEEIRKLQLNPNLSVKQIKKLSEEYLQMVFSNTPPSEIDMDYLWKIHQKGQELTLSLKDIETERANYEAKMGEIQQIGQAIVPLKDRIYSPQVLDVYNKIEQSIQGSLTKGTKEFSRLDKTYEDLEKVVSELSGEDFQQLIKLRYTYEEVMSNDFSFAYQTTAKQDLTELTVKLNPKEDLPDNIRVASRKLASFQVPTKGGLKINGSVGIGFGQFFARPQSYFVRDSIILADNEDSFVPYLSSFLHFYNYKPGQVSIGGSFGVGMPVFNSKGDQSIAFFLGPSLFLGGAQRITLTGGIMGARVQNLANGYKVGDVLDNPFLGVPTGNSYQLGYFLGISINVIGN